MTEMNLRCSGLDDAMACAGTLRAPEIAIEPEKGPAVFAGSATHELLSQVVDGHATTLAQLDVKGTAERFGVDMGELFPLVRFGLDAWAKLKEYFPAPVSEIPMHATIAPGVSLSGHPDVISVSGTRAAGLDWKSGRVDSSYAEQARGYCALTLLENPDVTEVSWYIVWLRYQEIEPYRMDRAAARVWLQGLVDNVVEWDGVYHPGKVCGYCRRSHECPAVVALARRDMAALGDLDVKALTERAAALDDNALVALHHRAGLVLRFAESLRELVRARVIANGGCIDTGYTRVTLEEQRRSEVDTLKAWPVLQKYIGDDVKLAECLTVKLSAAESVVAKAAGRGKGAAAKAALGKELEEAGALSISTIRKLREVRK
jgi:hypothetical protein